MKKIFIGSTKEAKAHAIAVADALRSLPDVQPILWFDYFMVGDITFIGIERLARVVDGAVILATPDDSSRIRDLDCKTPRANILFEYGYLTAALGRNRVALCRYEPTVLPSDFDGLMHVPMGGFDPAKKPLEAGLLRLLRWAEGLQPLPLGLPPTQLCHGLAGEWNVEYIFSLWRNLPISGDDFAVCIGKMYLHSNPDGTSVSGSSIARLQVKYENCHADFRVSDVILSIRVTAEGGFIIQSESHSRQLSKPIIGTPPQADGFEQDLKGGQIYLIEVEPHPSESCVLVGQHETRFAGAVRSRAGIRMWR